MKSRKDYQSLGKKGLRKLIEEITGKPCSSDSLKYLTDRAAKVVKGETGWTRESAGAMAIENFLLGYVPFCWDEDGVKTCPVDECEVVANTLAEIADIFGWRVVPSNGGKKRIPQSRCPTHRGGYEDRASKVRAAAGRKRPTQRTRAGSRMSGRKP